MNITSVTSRLTTGLVALVAGYASFSHIFQVARQAGEQVSVAAVLPLSIDGLILVGTLAMLDDKRSGRKPRLSARLAVAFGIVATLAANVASAHPTWTARAVAAVPPVAFLIAVEVLSRRGKLIHPEPVAPVEPVTAEPVAVEPEPTPEPVAAEPAEPAKIQRVKRASEPSRKPVPRSLTSADRIMSAHLAEPGATHARIAELAGVSLATVKRYRPTRSTGSASPAQPAEAVVSERAPELTGVAA
ncbi:DUF2637 domain-containing protein [Micromonospora arborensis]|uniref:DUF2637 domain-containing protein n=1 Tax=Micromonospora arborensis TaxID=2116518 RepID=UPI00142D681D|nr:DUF2637 domain-containing protein [Micromonospora arborensis]